ncbi:hypothetical protein AAHH88_00730 [Candidatus Hodgkinia cicadicola]
MQDGFVRLIYNVLGSSSLELATNNKRCCFGFKHRFCTNQYSHLNKLSWCAEEDFQNHQLQKKRTERMEGKAEERFKTV